MRNIHIHLAAELVDGRTVVGQYLLTGRKQPPPFSPVRSLFLSRGTRGAAPARIAIHEKLKRLIGQAELSCFPMGSFCTNLIANLLPEGGCQAVTEAERPHKVFIPNPEGGSELSGLDLPGMVETLLGYLREGCRTPPSTEKLLNLVLVDSLVCYPGGALNKRALGRLGVTVVDAPLTWPENAAVYDPGLLVGLLLSLV